MESFQEIYRPYGSSHSCLASTTFCFRGMRRNVRPVVIPYQACTPRSNSLKKSKQNLSLHSLFKQWQIRNFYLNLAWWSDQHFRFQPSWNFLAFRGLEYMCMPAVRLGASRSNRTFQSHSILHIPTSTKTLWGIFQIWSLLSQTVRDFWWHYL